VDKDRTVPIYEYACTSCSHEFEQLQKVSDAAPPCPECGEDVRKRVSQTSFQLKGTGWYVTDYKATPGSKSSGSTSPSSTGAGKDSDSTKGSDAKTEGPAPKATSESDKGSKEPKAAKKSGNKAEAA
jgi:putative FmdB family regulatory protein